MCDYHSTSLKKKFVTSDSVYRPAPACLVPSDQVGLEAAGGGTARLRCPARTKIMFIPHMSVFVRGRPITVIELSQRVELISKLLGHKEWVSGQPPANARVHVEFRLAQDCSQHQLMRDINPKALFGLLLHPNAPSEPQSQPQPEQSQNYGTSRCVGRFSSTRSLCFGVQRPPSQAKAVRPRSVAHHCVEHVAVERERHQGTPPTSHQKTNHSWRLRHACHIRVRGPTWRQDPSEDHRRVCLWCAAHVFDTSTTSTRVCR